MLHPTAFTLDLVLTRDCDPAVAKALGRFFESVTIAHPFTPSQRARHPSFSLTSRRYSLWKQLREHLDTPLANAIRRYRGAWEYRYLDGFELSAVGRSSPTFRIDGDAGVRAKIYGGPVDTVTLFQSGRASKPQQPLSATDRVVENIWAWDENLRAVILSVPSMHPSQASSKAATRFRSTMQTIRNLLALMRHFRGRRGADPLSAHDGAHPQLPDGKTRSQGQRFCELCWRLSMRSTAMGHRSRVPDIRSRQLSDRFCSEHDPSEPTSRYRVDLRYKKAFQRACLFGTESEFTADAQLPSYTSEEERRKAAYNSVHTRLRPLSQPDKPSLRETAWLLHQHGVRQADIARHLGTSRQTIFRTLKRIEQLLAEHEERRDQHFRQEDHGTTSKQSMLMEAVAVFIEDGYTPSEIAKMIDAPRDLILSVLRWPKEQPSPKKKMREVCSDQTAARSILSSFATKSSARKCV